MAVDYSIIVPAYNEEPWLPATLEAIDRAMATVAQHGEVIVTDNNSTDATGTIAREWGAQVVFEPINQIARARNRGAEVASGRYLIFIDADTLITPPLLERTLANLQGECCGGGSRVAFDSHGKRSVRLGLALWNSLSKKLGLAAGCYLYARREGYEAIGGFSEKVYASEEIWFSRALGKWGKGRGLRYEIIQEYPVVSSGRKVEWFATWQQTLLLLMVIVFPFFVRFKSLCGFWYRRPPG